eukprot:10488531-Prorocentrum_lima.AAC.1
MTSSLVGSEMCIRDSARPPPHTHTYPARHLEQFRQASKPHRNNRPLGHCLLYTSDAADDM